MAGPYDLPTDRVTGGGDPADDMNAANAAINDLHTRVDATVPKSLVDAKGDLLVGTADNTVGRLAVGSDGQIPYADSGEATGIRWDDAPSGGGSVALFTVPTPVYAAIGAYQPSIPVRGTNTYGTGGSDTSRRLAYPFIPSSDFTADQIGIEVTTAGAAGSVERLAIYGANAAENYPGSLIAEAASLADCTSTGYKMLTLTGGVEFTKGVLYWIAWGGEVAACTLRVYGTMELPKYPDTQARVFSATFNTCALLSGTGAFPGSWGTGGWANAQIPSIAFRRSA